MPKFSITNNRERSFPVRTDDGIRRVAPGKTETFAMAASLANYYRNVEGIKVGGGEAKADAGGGSGGGGSEKSLDTMTTAELQGIAEAEGIDISEQSTNPNRVAVIKAFRELFAGGTVETLRATAEKEEVDLNGRTTKAQIVNAIVAKRGVTE